MNLGSVDLETLPSGTGSITLDQIGESHNLRLLLDAPPPPRSSPKAANRARIDSSPHASAR